jgi:hypothetical protein
MFILDALFSLYTSVASRPDLYEDRDDLKRDVALGFVVRQLDVYGHLPS